MDQSRRRQLASKGGRAAHLKGTAHEWTSEEARQAGRKGGAILLRSGDDARISRIDNIAIALDLIATELDEMKDSRGPTHVGVFAAMRRSIRKANGAVDRLETHRRSGST